jgi:tRNA pseudouridine55 synthase
VARRRPPTVHGLAVVDKPAGVTSHDVVGVLRRRFGERRIGHAGTLDPGATGVLVVGVGMVTRLLRFVSEGRKSYVGEVVLGVETDTLDADGAVTTRHEMGGVDLDRDSAVVAEHLVGDIDQVPPMVSALSIGGRRLHDLARQGIEVEREARRVTVYRFDVVSVAVDPDGSEVLWIEVDCSAGTYVRTLAADLGHLLGGGAHLRNLRRTAVVPFTIDEAALPDECELLPPIEAVRALAKVTVDDGTRARIAVGAVLPAPDGDGPWAMVAGADELLAVYEPHRDGMAKPAVVLPTASDH